MQDMSTIVKTLRGILLGTILLSGCDTAHDVAVSSFRVIDAPANYIRRHIDQPTPTPAPGTVASDSVKPGRTINATPAPPPTAQTRQHPAVTPAPRTATNENTRPSPTPAPRHVTAPPAGQFPTAKPVPGKPGYVYSPFDPNGGYVDVTGFSPGSKVKDPYSGKVFLVP